MRKVPLPDPLELSGPFSHLQGEPEPAGKRGVELVPDARPFTTQDRDDLALSEAPEIWDTTSKAIGDFVTSFDGQVSTGWIPPDTVLAVGPSHVIEAVNSGFAIYSKSGTLLQSYRTFSDFFAPLQPSPWSGYHFDPRIIFDPHHSRFVMLALARDVTNQNSYVFVGISGSSDPLSFWYIYRYQADWGPHADSWLDYASLGADLWGLYFTGNYYKWNDNSSKYATIWASSPDVFYGGTGNGTQFYDLHWPGLFGGKAYSLQVAHPNSQSYGETFFVNTKSSSGNDILLWKLTGDRANSPSLSKSSIGIKNYDAIGANNVDQPGTATGLDGGDSRVMNAVYSQRRVYAVLATAPTGSSGGWITARLNVDSNSKEWDTLLWSGDGYFYIYPAIAISGGTSTCARIGVMGSWTHASTQHPSGLFKIYDTCNSTSGPFISFISGLGSYVALDSNNRNRWGDYSGAAYDWQTGHLWGAVEYAGAGNTWRTRLAAFKFAPDLSANFDYYCNGLSCYFYNASVVGALPITSYLWTFGDTGATANGPSANHVFSYAGTFLVTLEVTDSGGTMSTVAYYVTVEETDPCLLRFPACEVY
ncbi:MAG: PKD domain-containing protein [Thermoanaerobaculia bacterium]|nr:PKD domain-containing protein [Thermoanaerobaculia bacterium]